MKGFKDKSGKFRPTENKNGVRKSRDINIKTEGVRLQRDFGQMMEKFHQDQDRRDEYISPKWNSMTAKQRLDALNVASVIEKNMWGDIVMTREDMAKLEYDKLPHYAKTDLGFHYFKLNREGRPVN